MSKPVRMLLGGALLALMSVNLGAHIYAMFLPPPGSSDGWSGRWDGTGEPKITGVNSDGPATALQVGDEIVAINGVKIKDDPRILNYGNRVPPGTRFTMTIRRAGELREIEIQTVPHPWRPRFNPLFLVMLPFLLTAWALFLLRPNDKQAWLLAVMLATLTGLMGQMPSNLSGWVSLTMGAARALGTLFLPVFVHFFLIFPERSPLLRRWPRLETWLYAPYLLILLTLGPVRSSQDLFMWLLRQPWLRPLVSAAVVLFALYLAAGLVCLAINYRAANPDARRRLRVVMAGSAAGVFNLLLLVLGEMAGQYRWLEPLWSWLDFATLITFPLIPLSFVYAILRHKVIPIGLIIRRGMRYLLVSRGSILLVMAGVAVVMFFVMDAFFSYFKPGSGRIVGSISAVVAIIVWQLARAFHRRVVAPKIDRLFFHQAYDTQQIIAELAESLRTATSLPRLLEMVATRIQSALQTTNVVILLRDEASGDYRCAYACEYSFHNRQAMRYPCETSLPRDVAVITRLAASAQPIDLDGHDPQFSLPSTNGSFSRTSNEEREALRQMKSALLMPIVGKDGLLGLISLGPHLGDLPFSSEDKRLLLSVGGPTSFALENTRLIERMIEDARRHKELEAENEQRAKELEEARRLQLSMLPKTVPQLPHLEIAAYMKTATEVGGDYYDFHLADDGTLTVAVGDATGHGLKAGTVVTAMKSLFHCYAGEPELLPVLNQSSRVLKRMNLRSMFMGLTVIKLRGQQLKISAAGMPPALIYRAQTGTVEEVLIKAMPLGSMTNYTYHERELALHSGDVLVLMSDGLPERFNPEGEMFDYTRVKAALAAAATRTAQAIIEHFVNVGERWAQGRPQDDDVTFVVLKVK